MNHIQVIIYGAVLNIVVKNLAVRVSELDFLWIMTHILVKNWQHHHTVHLHALNQFNSAFLSKQDKGCGYLLTFTTLLLSAERSGSIKGEITTRSDAASQNPQKLKLTLSAPQTSK